MMKSASSVFPGITLSVVPNRFHNNSHGCEAIVLKPITPQVTREMIDCVETSFGFRAFDLLGISSYSKSLAQESKTVMDMLKIAFGKHQATEVVLFHHVDIVRPGETKRFSSQSEEDLKHKESLLRARNAILAVYPDVNVSMVYARIVDNGTRIRFSDVLPDLQETIRMYTPFRFRGIYDCEDVLLICPDFRIRRESRACMRYSLGRDKFTLVGLPGASKRCIEGSDTAWKEINRAVKNDCKRLVVMHHSDCGAYDGAEAFTDAIAEEQHHREQMNIFAKMMSHRHPGIEVIKVFTRFIDDCEKIEFVQFD